MTTHAKIGFGTLFQTFNGSSGNSPGDSPDGWTTHAEITKLNMPKMKRDQIDGSHEQSPGAWKEFIPGMKDGGDFVFECILIPGQGEHSTLIDELDDDYIRHRRIVFPNGATWSFDAFLTGLDTDAPLDGKMTATATFKVTGQPGPLTVGI